MAAAAAAAIAKGAAMRANTNHRELPDSDELPTAQVGQAITTDGVNKTARMIEIKNSRIRMIRNRLAKDRRGLFM